MYWLRRLRDKRTRSERFFALDPQSSHLYRVREAVRQKYCGTDSALAILFLSNNFMTACRNSETRGKHKIVSQFLSKAIERCISSFQHNSIFPN